MPVLAIDAGNTTTVFGLMDGLSPVFVERTATNDQKTDLEYMVDLMDIFDSAHIPLSSVQDCVITSAVPKIDTILKTAVERLFSLTPFIVSASAELGLDVRMDRPEELGGSLIASALAVLHEYPLPAAIVRMGTATTVGVLDKGGTYLGGAMLPGIAASRKALTSGTAALPDIRLERPEHLLGCNTEACMNAGSFYGHAFMIGGVLSAVKEELPSLASVIVTGRFADALQPYLPYQAQYDEHLTLRGLIYALYHRRFRL